jgi:hypothetical protein
MPKVDEFQIQRAFVMWYCGVRYPERHPRAGQWKIEPAKLPGIVSWHTPNGGRRDAFEAKRFKEMGVLAGIPDYFMLWGRLHALEFKEPGEGRLSAAQTGLHPQLTAAGALVATVDSLAIAKATVIGWGLARC